MFKRIASMLAAIAIILFSTNSAVARTKHLKKKKTKHKTHKVSKHKRKYRRYKQGNGPDLKTITTDSTYTEDTSNGVNPIETKQPGI
ncbi:MAG: hypothetical protein EHM20_05435 [Alphaproteobacteria bacterium]|nr:MAG: hypothetical protein EHM20_05435 [Alphaproteobacteria bacterium]